MPTAPLEASAPKKKAPTPKPSLATAERKAKAVTALLKKKLNYPMKSKGIVIGALLYLQYPHPSWKRRARSFMLILQPFVCKRAKGGAT